MKDPTQHNSEGEEWGQYRGRGLSDRIVYALMANGVLEPERLLFMVRLGRKTSRLECERRPERHSGLSMASISGCLEFIAG